MWVFLEAFAHSLAVVQNLVERDYFFTRGHYCEIFNVRALLMDLILGLRSLRPDHLLGVSFEDSSCLSGKNSVWIYRKTL